jgi:hypothetical protein
MRENNQQPQQNLKFDAMMQTLDGGFQKIPDQRAANAKFSLADTLKAGFAIFSIKSPSLLDFKTQTVAEASNLRSIYLIEGDLPCDNQMRGILDPLDPGHLRPLFRSLFLPLKKAGVLKEYHYWGKHVLVSIDGVEHFCSEDIHCEHCTTRKHRNGKTSYHHSGLAAVMVHPAYSEVFPLDFEPILRQDGAAKNDCEQNGAKRLCAALATRYPDLHPMVVEDALYANAPHVRQITGYGWKYILNVTPDGHESLFRQYAGRLERKDFTEYKYETPDKTTHRYRWTRHLCLNDGAIDVHVNFLWYQETTADGTVTEWTWVTNLPLTKKTVERVMRAGWSRWKIENETFNTLKNQGYHFEHNYGHGAQNLATNLALLLFLAFLVDQLQQRCCQTFRRLRAGLKIKVKLWQALRSAFQMLLFPSMEMLFRHLCVASKVQLE